MIDHISIAVRDLSKSAAFYAAILAPLELSRLVDRGDRIGFGKRYPEIWLNARPAMALVPIAPLTPRPYPPSTPPRSTKAASAMGHPAHDRHP
jgi:catechol 2,3-dioxygenase-like lactoylglutathione lyase family enzyme